MNTQLLDQRGDSNWRELQQYLQLYPFPNYVLRDEHGDSRKLAELCRPPKESAKLYADVRGQYQFPIHTKAALAVSYVYYLNHQAEINSKIRPLIEDRFDKAAEYFNATGDLRRLHEKHASLNSDSPLPDSSFALVWVSDGHKDRRYPLRNTMEVKAAARWYQQHEESIRNEYPLSDRQTIAKKILAKAAQFGADLSDEMDFLEKMAGHGVGSPTKLAAAIRDRAKAGNRVAPDMRSRLTKLADSIDQRPKMFLEPAMACEVASVIDMFDRTHGLLNKYSSMIPSPEDLVYGTTNSALAAVKKAACQLVTGSLYDANDFSKLAVSDVRDLFGDEIAQEVSHGLQVDPEKMAEVAETLPRNDASVFESLLSEKGVQPLAKEAAYQPVGFSTEELQQLATL